MHTLKRTSLNATVLAGLGLLYVGAPALAQQATPPPATPPHATAPATAPAPATPPRGPCQKEAFGHFDFWVGNWDVFSGPEHELVGTNVIEKVEKGCLIKENWTNTEGGTGFSINYYDAVTDQWRQVWVAGGYSIDYTGDLNAAGEMALEGEIHYYGRGTSVPFKGTWTPNADGSVTQLFEQYDAEKTEWTTWFKGHYVRQTD